MWYMPQKKKKEMWYIVIFLVLLHESNLTLAINI